jgi:transcriptional regulator with XRE-family HTH domain
VKSSLGAADLRARRTALGLSQAALGRALGVPQTTIDRWERGVIRIRHPAMLALALEALGNKRAR